jgi:PAS domain S-box-containing protein
LILEDNPADAELLERMLRKKMVCECYQSKDKPTFLHALDQFAPDIILSDHALPKFNSTDALVLSRLRFPGVPFIMVTGSVSEEFAATIMKMGADDYILKDRLARLPAAMEAALKRYSAERENREAQQKIIESENNLRAIFENTSEGFLLLDRDAVIKAFNSRVGEYTFISRDKEIQAGQSIFDFIEESRIDFFKGLISKALNGAKTQYERSYNRKSGEVAWIDFSITPVIEDGEVKGVCITGRNITEKKVAEQQREFDSNNLRALINNTDDLMWSVDKDLKLITFNEAFNKVIEFTSGKPLEKGAHVLSTQFTDDKRKRYKTFYERALSGETFTIIDHFDHPVEFWSEISFYPIGQGSDVIGTACFSRNITERKKAEEDLKLLEQQILEQKIQEQKKIARAIITGQEKERNHIGQELHDNINQILAGTKMYLSIAGKKNEELKELIKYPMELVDTSIEEIRLLCQKLVTPVKDINLEEMVSKILINLANDTSIKTSFNYAVSKKPLPDEIKLNVYRIVQEQVNNIIKHAGAKTVMVIIETKGKAVNIIVEDDGKGFNPKAKRSGVGISNMQNRVGAFNGQVKIKTSPGKGCKIMVSIPY